VEALAQVRTQWRTIPNLLSFGRLVLTPLVAWLIIADMYALATGFMGLMGASDYFDGYIARRTDTVTELGVVLDPVSDRVLVMTTIVVLMLERRLPAWLGAPVLLRDVVLSLVFLGLARRGFGKPKVRRVGKSATFALLFAIPAVTLGGVLRTPGLVMFGVGGILYFIATYRYWQDVQAFLAAQRVPFAQGE
jgi:cardiolipin synthase